MRWTAAIALALLAFSPASAFAADGALDPSFGNGGSLSLSPQRFSGASGLAVDAQGRIVVGITLEDGSLLRTRAAVMRLLPNGALDASFGVGGIATVEPPAPYLTSRSEDFTVDAQGRLLLVGEMDDDIPAVMRLLPDGSLDPSFASGGLLVASDAYGPGPAWWLSIAVDRSGILVAGARENAPPYGTGLGTSAIVARITDSGALDPSFASGGVLQLPGPEVTFASHASLALDSRSRIVLGLWGATTRNLPGDAAALVERLTSQGVPDTSFGSGGRVVLGALTGSGPQISLTRADSIVAVGAWFAHGSSAATTNVTRLLPDGKLDATFAAGGELSSYRGPPPYAGALDCQDDLLLSGPAGVRRYGADGRLDPAFHIAPMPRVAVGDTTGVAGMALFAFSSAGLVLAGGASDGPSVIGGATQVGHSSMAFERIAASCPVTDSRPPIVTLTCAKPCRRIEGLALDDPVGRGVRRVLLGVERITGTQCAAWDGRRFAALSCARAAARLVAVAAKGGAFRVPALGSGRYVVRAVAVDRDGHRSRVAVRRLTL